MGIFAKLFGSEKIIDAGIAGIDKAFYTAEEKAENDIKKIGWKLAFMKAYEPFKIAQRFVALMIGLPFVAIHSLTSVMWISVIFWYRENVTAYQFMVEQLGKVAEMNNATLGEPLLWIVIFYFAGGASEGLIEKARGFRSKK